MTQEQAGDILKTAAADPTFTVGKLMERVKTDKDAFQAKFEVGEDITILDAIVALILFDIKFESDYNEVHYDDTGSSQTSYKRNGFIAMLTCDVSDREKRDLWKNWCADSKYSHTITLPIKEETVVRDLIQEAVNFSYYCQADKLAAKLKENRPDGKPRGRFLDYFENEKLNIVPTISLPAASSNSTSEDAQALINSKIRSSKKKCVVFTGAPGTGKTYCVEKYVEGQEQMKNFDRKEYFVQFHSSYDYTDFVEGLRPIKINGEMEFERMDGIFKAFCRKVAELPNKKDDKDIYYYFVIDEINRADLGRVFGELMYCFEKRGKEHSIATQYANLPAYGKDEEKGKGVRIKDGFHIKDEKGNLIFIKDDCFKDGFYIPDNVVIIGTMNDIDRSVETFDFALRRRFDWVEIEADAVMESSLIAMRKDKLKRELTDNEKQSLSDLVLKIKAKKKAGKEEKDGLNGIIEKQSGLGREFKIGPAYFKEYDGDNLNDIWTHNIEPILKEYMRGRQGADKFISECKAALFPNGQTGAQE